MTPPVTAPPEAAARHDVLGIGFGPSNLALAIALREAAPAARRLRTHFVERQAAFAWHRDMLLPGADMQVSFVKDLVTLRDPTSPFSFLNYLREKGRLAAFLNLKTFNPSRVEYNDYLAWAAAHVADGVSYGETVEAVEPVLMGDAVAGFRARAVTGAGRTRVRLARHLVIAPGGRARVPAPFAGLDDARVVHTSRYLSGVAEALAAGPARPRIAVVGAGQSAVETMVDAGRRFPGAHVELLFRAHAPRPADDSAFANTIFDPEAVDMVFGLPEPRRHEVLRSLAGTNYAAVDADLIAELHALVYDEAVLGERRHALRNHTEIVAAEATPDAVVLTLRDLRDGTVEARRYDAVVLGTGYERRGLPDMLAPLAPHIASPRLTRDYRLPLRDAAGATVYIQGWSEDSHGLADTLLSLLAVRAGEIAGSIGATTAAEGAVPRRGAL